MGIELVFSVVQDWPNLGSNLSYICLMLALTSAVLIIGAFNYYISVAKDERFKKRFFEMSGLTLGVSALSFLIGFIVRAFFGVDV